MAKHEHGSTPFLPVLIRSHLAFAVWNRAGWSTTSVDDALVAVCDSMLGYGGQIDVEAVELAAIAGVISTALITPRRLRTDDESMQTFLGFALHTATQSLLAGEEPLVGLTRIADEYGRIFRPQPPEPTGHKFTVITESVAA